MNMNEISHAQEISIKKIYFNESLLYFNFFKQKTKMFPEHVIIHDNFIFFFVKNKDYFRAKQSLAFFRKTFGEKKVLIIRAEKNLIKLLFGFFPDVSIHDIEIHFNEESDKIIADVLFFTYEERGIAIGREGKYIKVLNAIFNEFILPIKINCKTAIIT